MKYLFVFLFSSSAFAVIVQLTDLQTMAQRSDIVAHGYVGDQRVVKDDLGRLITLTSIEVIDGLYGAKTGEVITVYQVGGEKDGLVMPLLGGQHYRFGQELILFGLKLGDTYVSYGAGQGKLDIIKDAHEDSVKEDLGDVGVLDARKGENRALYAPTPLSFSDTTVLKNEIRQMLKTR